MHEEDAPIQLPAGVNGKELLALVKGNGSLAKLFHYLERSPEARRILFLSKNDLFELEGSNQVPWFFVAWDSTPALKSKTLMAAIAEAGAARTLGSDLAPQLFGGEQNLSAGGELLAFALLASIQEDKDLGDLLREKELTFAVFQKAIRQMGGIKKVVDRVGAKVGERLGEDESFAHQVERIAKDFEEASRQNFDAVMTKMRNLIPDSLIQFHLAGQQWVNRITKLTNLKATDLEHCLDELVRLDLVETQSAIAWCNDCGRDRTAYQVIAGTWGPSRYRKLKCFGCGRRLSYTAILTPQADFRTALLAKDGLLSAYIAHRLTTTNRLKSAFLTVAGTEWDFHTEGNSLVEVKMLQTSRDKRSLERSIEQALGEIKKKGAKAIKEIPDLNRIVLATNVEVAITEKERRLGSTKVEILVLGPEKMIADLKPNAASI